MKVKHTIELRKRLLEFITGHQYLTNTPFGGSKVRILVYKQNRFQEEYYVYLVVVKEKHHFLQVTGTKLIEDDAILDLLKEDLTSTFNEFKLYKPM